jgi:hypothetical protein
VSFRLPPPSLVVAIVAMAVATAGTVTTAALVTGKDIKNNSVHSRDIQNNTVKGKDIKNGGIGLADISSSAAAALKGNTGATGPAGPAGPAGAPATRLWALVDHTGALVDGSGATAATRLGAGLFRVTFNQTITACISQAGSTDVTGGAVPTGAIAMIVATDNRQQANASTVDVSTTDPAGNLTDPASGDGFTVTVFC